MTEKAPILKGRKVKTRILRPSEYHDLRLAVPHHRLRTLLDTCLMLGARFEECCTIQWHREWFDGNFINLPSEAQLKVKQKQSERSIRLSLKARSIMPFFFAPPTLPTSQAWNRRLKKWAIKADLDPVGITTRSLRKTYESWLVFYFPSYVHLIYLSQGHSDLTSLKHYQGLPFLEADREDMKEYVEGWI